MAATKGQVRCMSWRYQTSHSTQHFHSNPYFTLVWMERGKKKRPSPWRHTLSLPPLSRSLGPEILSSLFAWGGSKEFYNFSQHCCRELFVFRDPTPSGADRVTLYSTSSPQRERIRSGGGGLKIDPISLSLSPSLLLWLASSLVAGATSALSPHSLSFRLRMGVRQGMARPYQRPLSATLSSKRVHTVHMNKLCGRSEYNHIADGKNSWLPKIAQLMMIRFSKDNKCVIR